MFLKYFDFISPPITLFFKREDKHINHISGIISIITYILILTSIIYYGIDFLQRNLNNFYYYNKTIDDAGIFPLNSSSIFHFVTVGYNPIDFQAVTIIGLNRYISTYVNDNDISKFPHWVYGKCEIDDIKGVENEIKNTTIFFGGACIKKMWDVKKQKYYSIKDKENFDFPQLKHGASHPDTINYGIIIEKCRNSTMKLLGEIKPCHDSNQISKYISDSINVAVYLIDHSLLANDYHNPLSNFLYKIPNGILESSFTANQLNFYPIEIKSHVGFLFDKVEVHNSFMFFQNTKSTIGGEMKGILCSFHFWMQNNLQIYERSFTKIQNSLANIGGISKIIFTFSALINHLVNKYFIIQDTIAMTNKDLQNKKNLILHSSTNNSSDNLLQTLNNNEHQTNHIILNPHESSLIKVRKHTIRFTNKNTDIKTGVNHQLKRKNNIVYKSKTLNVTSFMQNLVFRYFNLFQINHNQKIQKYINLRFNYLDEQLLFDLYLFYEKQKLLIYSNHGITQIKANSINQKRNF